MTVENYEDEEDAAKEQKVLLQSCTISQGD